MYAHSLTFDQLTRHLNTLTARSLLVFKESKYWTTDKEFSFSTGSQPAKSSEFFQREKSKTRLVNMGFNPSTLCPASTL
jgi:hypothetical protein